MGSATEAGSSSRLLLEDVFQDGKYHNGTEDERPCVEEDPHSVLDDDKEAAEETRAAGCKHEPRLGTSSTADRRGYKTEDEAHQEREGDQRADEVADLRLEP